MIGRVKGMHDVVPPEDLRRAFVTGRFGTAARCAGFRELVTPVVEHTELFLRGIGGGTDIVDKEMYTFEDQGGRSLSLRPEGTAPAVRAFIEEKAWTLEPETRWWYQGPMYRRERPQKGRYRQFFQVGVELFGVAEPGADVEVIGVAVDFFRRLGLDGLSLEINSIGCPACRQPYNGLLAGFLSGRISELCDDCRRRTERNPLRTFDCKNETCRQVTRDAPRVSDHLCGECTAHFSAVRTGLDGIGVGHAHNPGMVRGLDYYTRTTFEFLTDALGAQSAVLAGGRYDGLVSLLGGPPTPAIGFAAGVERIGLLIDRPFELRPDIYLACLGDAAHRRGLELLHTLRRDGTVALMDHGGRSLKAQLKRADRSRARLVAIVGDDELAHGVALVRDMETGRQQQLPLDRLDGTIPAKESPGEAG